MTTRTPRDYAREYIARGWAPIPLPYRSKEPVLTGWNKLEITAENVDQYFNGARQNISILTGEPSKGLTDVDIDCHEARAAKETFLPKTDSTFGRASNPESHWLYTVDPPLRTKKFQDPLLPDTDAKSMLLELRSSKLQTVFPGSVHEKGEPIDWVKAGEPAKVDGELLQRRCALLAATALIARRWPGTGSRHELSLALSGWLLRGEISEKTVVAIIQSAATIAGDTEVADRVQAVKDTAAAITDGEHVTGYPTAAKIIDDRALKAISDWLNLPKAAQVDLEDGNGAEGQYKPTDLGNAERLVNRHGADLLYVPVWGWMVHDDHRWVRDEGDIRVTRLATETVRAIYQEAASEPDSDRRASLSKHAIASERAARINAMVSLARADKRVEASADQFDADPYRLACLNGTLDLRTGELSPHSREDRITKLAPVAYDPEARAPLWQAFLRRIFSEDEEMIAYVRRAAGYALTGDTGERALFVLHGSGANGKSTLLETLRAVLGDYALRTPAETLLAKREGGIPNDVARLRGARLVTASETEDGRRFAEAFIKDLTGGDTLSARFMRGEWFDFKPVCKVWLGTNHKPEVRGTDSAIWDRIRLIPFSVSIPKEDRDTKLAARLRQELPGILTWAVEGCWDWHQNGLREPEAVRAATSDYRADSDVLGAFIAERCDTGRTKSVTASALYNAYKTWCETASERPLTQRTFGMRLRERGFERRRGTGNQHHWDGISLNNPTPAEGE
jgi:putative DNA primase/helicase